MDRYIDDFCERHFSDFEQLETKNRSDEFFNHLRMRPVWFVRWAVIVSCTLIVASFALPFEVECKSQLLKDVGLGLLTSSLVAFYFNLREESVRYYGKLVDLIECRMRSIDIARQEANEYIMNTSLFEGLQLLQFTVQNALQFASYLNEKLKGRISLDITNGIIAKRDLTASMSKDEMWQHVQEARQTIGVIQRRLQHSKADIRAYAWNEKVG